MLFDNTLKSILEKIKHDCSNTVFLSVHNLPS